ncbi:hypothetical protein I4U23_001711 [Adineta vaga]|nr:hypothetical protein I4U23_001711 [Adineta vaga]
MKSIPSDKMNVISGCLHEYNHDISQLPIVQEFEKQYVSDQSIWWYTRESFVSRLLNKALSILNLDLLFLFSFLIHDIQDRLLKDQCRSAIKVYHGQIMSIKELYLFRDYIGKCFSINTFLWTISDRKHLLRSLSGFPIGEDLVRILFEIDADPRLNSTKAFASITHSAHFSPVEQVLFQFGSVFQLMDMRHDKKNSVWIVKISLVNIREEYDQRTLLPRGQILSDMGKIDDAEKYYNRILHEIPDTHRDFARCHYLLGLLLFSKGDYELSLYWFNEVLQLFPTDDPNLANSYYSIGCIYQKKSDHCRAMRYYEEALNIWKQTCENNEPIEMAECLNNIGCIYENEKFYSKALEFHRKELIIREKLHSCLGKTYNNIGNIYFRLGEYDVALENYTYGFALKIKTLPLDDPSLVRTLINIGLVYEYDNNIQEALKAYKRAAFLLENVDPSSDSFHVEIQEDIQRVSALLDK